MLKFLFSHQSNGSTGYLSEVSRRMCYLSLPSLSSLYPQSQVYAIHILARLSHATAGQVQQLRLYIATRLLYVLPYWSTYTLVLTGFPLPHHCHCVTVSVRRFCCCWCARGALDYLLFAKARRPLQQVTVTRPPFSLRLVHLFTTSPASGELRSSQNITLSYTVQHWRVNAHGDTVDPSLLSTTWHVTVHNCSISLFTESFT